MGDWLQCLLEVRPTTHQKSTWDSSTQRSIPESGNRNVRTNIVASSRGEVTGLREPEEGSHREPQNRRCMSTAGSRPLQICLWSPPQRHRGLQAYAVTVDEAPPLKFSRARASMPAATRAVVSDVPGIGGVLPDSDGISHAITIFFSSSLVMTPPYLVTTLPCRCYTPRQPLHFIISSASAAPALNGNKPSEHRRYRRYNYQPEPKTLHRTRGWLYR